MEPETYSIRVLYLPAGDGVTGLVRTIDASGPADYLSQLQRMLDNAYLEELDLGVGVKMYLDEHSKDARGLPANPAATRIVHLAGGGLRPDDYITGPVILAGANGPIAPNGIPLDSAVPAIAFDWCRESGVPFAEDLPQA